MVRKGQKEKNYASARRGKAKKRKITLLHSAERPKRGKTRFCVTQKGQKEELRRKKWLFERKERGEMCRKVAF